MLTIILEHGPNPDLMYGQGNGTGYWQPPKCPKKQAVQVADLAAARLVYRTWLDKARLGYGNITHQSGRVYDGDTWIAKVSYNGRIWTPYEHGDPRHAEIHVA